jgi:hypothetical protein
MLREISDESKELFGCSAKFQKGSKSCLDAPRNFRMDPKSCLDAPRNFRRAQRVVWMLREITEWAKVVARSFTTMADVLKELPSGYSQERNYVGGQ